MDPTLLHQHRIPHSHCLVPENSNHEHHPDVHRTGKPKLRISLPLHLDRISMEMWVSRCSVYTKLLADTVIQAVKDGELTKERKDKAPSIMPGAFGPFLYLVVHTILHASRE